MNHFDFSGCRVILVGDLSPEAPVPMLLHDSERAVLGGAANVCANLATLGAEVVARAGLLRDGASFSLYHSRCSGMKKREDPDRRFLRLKERLHKTYGLKMRIIRLGDRG
jgi:bifunctional ADP-heptose synthase (sugar kinase/adenylyltransferase)